MNQVGSAVYTSAPSQLGLGSCSGVFWLKSYNDKMLQEALVVIVERKIIQKQVTAHYKIYSCFSAIFVFLICFLTITQVIIQFFSQFLHI